MTNSPTPRPTSEPSATPLIGSGDDGGFFYENIFVIAGGCGAILVFSVVVGICCYCCCKSDNNPSQDAGSRYVQDSITNLNTNGETSEDNRVDAATTNGFHVEPPRIKSVAPSDVGQQFPSSPNPVSFISTLYPGELFKPKPDVESCWSLEELEIDTDEEDIDQLSRVNTDEDEFDTLSRVNTFDTE